MNQKSSETPTSILIFYNSSMNLCKIPYPKNYKSLRLFVTYIREFQLKRYKLLNELNGKNPLNPWFELCNSTLQTIYVLMLQSIVRSKPKFLIWNLSKK